MSSEENITTIITTAPHRFMNENHHLLHTVKSLHQVPFFTKNPIMICFDGGEIHPHHPLDKKCATPTDLKEYEIYKKNNKAAILAFFPHAQFFELPFRGCLTKNIHQCFHDVTTDYVNIMQHDLPIRKMFPVEDIIKVMRVEPTMKLVRYSVRTNKDHENFTRKKIQQSHNPRPPLTKEEIVKGNLTFSRCHQWSDQNHITTVGYYNTIVFPETLPLCSFMEHHLLTKPAFDHDHYGTYYFGGYEDGLYSIHSDGRNSRPSTKKTR